MTVYNVEKALFIYKSVTKTQKSEAAANLNLEMKYIFFSSYFCVQWTHKQAWKNVNWSSVLVVRAL